LAEITTLFTTPPFLLSSREKGGVCIKPWEIPFGKHTIQFWRPEMKVDFKTLMKMYKTGKLTPEIRKDIEKDLAKKEEHARQRHFKTHDGRTFDLIALKENMLKDKRFKPGKFHYTQEGRFLP
jgi:hypothetical protein